MPYASFEPMGLHVFFVASFLFCLSLRQSEKTQTDQPADLRLPVAEVCQGHSAVQAGQQGLHGLHLGGDLRYPNSDARVGNRSGTARTGQNLGLLDELGGLGMAIGRCGAIWRPHTHPSPKSPREFGNNNSSVADVAVESTGFES